MTRLFSENRSLLDEVRQLEHELGRMEVTDPNRIFLVEVQNPEVPPEIAKYVRCIWQFRCYLPVGYEAHDVSGFGRVTEDGIYHQGSSSRSWRPSRNQPTHVLMTISITKNENEWRFFYSYGGNSGSSSWNPSNPDLTQEQLVVQKLVSQASGARSFDRDTILPLIKIYDPMTAVEIDVDGTKKTAFQGGIFAICPKTRDLDFKILQTGVTPPQWESNKLAEVASDD